MLEALHLLIIIICIDDKIDAFNHQNFTFNGDFDGISPTFASGKQQQFMKIRTVHIKVMIIIMIDIKIIEFTIGFSENSLINLFEPILCVKFNC